MTKAELISRLATHTSVSKAGDDDASGLPSTIADVVSGGETVTSAGVGILSTKSRPAPQSSNPYPGKCIAIVDSNAPSFKAGNAPRNAVN